MTKSIKVWFCAIACMLALAVTGIFGFSAAATVAAADEGKEIASVSSAANEFLYYGDVINSTVDVTYTDGSAGKAKVNWENLNALEVNQNFTMTEAIGTVEGTDERVSRRFFTMPRGLVYFVNCGSLTGQPVTDTLNTNDVYYDLNTEILENYEAPTSTGKLLNRVPDQEKASGNSWGYTHYNASFKVSSKQMPTKAGDPMPPAFPYNAIRSSDKSDLEYGIEYNLGGLAAGKYRLYIGTRSHWHARHITLRVNGSDIDTFNIDAVSKINTYDNIDANGGNIKIHLVGGAGQNEANVAFIAVQTMEEANNTPASAPDAVVRTQNLETGVTEFTVGGVKAGSKVQVSLASGSYNVIHEAIVGEDEVDEAGNYTVKAPHGAFDGIYSIRLTAINAAGASDSIVVYITDITEYSFTPRSLAYTSQGVTFDIRGTAESGIVRLVVTYDYVDTVITPAEDPNLGDTEYASTYTVTENGVYKFTLYSGNNAYVSRDVTVNTIDNRDVSLAVNMASKGLAGGRIAVTLDYDGATEAVGYEVYDVSGKTVASGADVTKAIVLEAGRYAFAVQSASGKTATASVLVSDKPTYFKVTAKSVSGGTTYTLKGAGKEISSFYAYGVNSEGEATRLRGSGSSVNDYNGASSVVARIEYKDGTVEFACIAISSGSSDSDNKGCGSNIGFSSLIASMVLILACGAALTLIRVGKRVRK